MSWIKNVKNVLLYSEPMRIASKLCCIILILSFEDAKKREHFSNLRRSKRFRDGFRPN